MKLHELKLPEIKLLQKLVTVNAGTDFVQYFDPV